MFDWNKKGLIEEVKELIAKVENDKTINNGGDGSGNPDQKRNEKGEWTKDDAAIQAKKDKLVPVEISKDEIPQFKSKKDLGNWVRNVFKEIGKVNIEDTNTEVILSGSSANRETYKHRATREENKAVFQKFQELVEKSIKFDEREADENHIHDQDLYFNKFNIDGNPYSVEFAFDYLKDNNEFRYAGHKVINSIKIAASPTQAFNAIQTAAATDNIINDLEINFNPLEEKYKNNAFIDALTEVIAESI